MVGRNFALCPRVVACTFRRLGFGIFNLGDRRNPNQTILNSKVCCATRSWLCLELYLYICVCVFVFVFGPELASADLGVGGAVGEA